MAKTSGFLDYPREDFCKEPVKVRVRSFREFERPSGKIKITRQSARCMDCGVPHCHTFGCPLANCIPDWNDLVCRGQWKSALELLESTDNFPEFTGRICPAPCEAACTLAINQPAVTIRQIELAIIERGWQEGWINPRPADSKTGKRVAVVGSGPAGLAAAQQLARSGHEVVVFEKSDRLGGLLRYGIPDFKLEKHILDRRLDQMRSEGVSFETSVSAGIDISLKYMQASFHAIVLASGASVARDLECPGRELQGIHLAMDYLVQQNKITAGDKIDTEIINARDKHVVVIGGGDTGSDCVGTARRQGARHITQVELLPMPPRQRAADNPWPMWPNTLRTSSSHEEGCERMWSLQTVGFTGQGDRVKALSLKRLLQENHADAGTKKKRPDADQVSLKADLVLLAMGFLRADSGPISDHAGLQRDTRGNLVVNARHMSSCSGIFAAGDCVSGASLVVHAIHQGRQAAKGVNQFLR